MCDPFVQRLVNQRMVTTADFETVKGGVYLVREAARTVIGHWENHLRRPLGGSAAAGTPRAMIDGAALAMLGVVLGESERLDLPLRGLEDEPGTWSGEPSRGRPDDTTSARRTAAQTDPELGPAEDPAGGNEAPAERAP